MLVVRATRAEEWNCFLSVFPVAAATAAAGGVVAHPAAVVETPPPPPPLVITRREQRARPLTAPPPAVDGLTPGPSPGHPVKSRQLVGRETAGRPGEEAEGSGRAGGRPPYTAAAEWASHSPCPLEWDHLEDEVISTLIQGNIIQNKEDYWIVIMMW